MARGRGNGGSIGPMNNGQPSGKDVDVLLPDPERKGLLARPAAEPILLVAVFFVMALALAAGRWEINAFPEIRIALGFFLFFIAPGFVLGSILVPAGRLRPAERMGTVVALSMGAWAFPGLLCYHLGLSLHLCLLIELSVLSILLVMALTLSWVSGEGSDPDPKVALNRWGTVSVWAVILLIAAITAWTGAFRGVTLDWDYFNYISAVRKLVSWSRAGIGHFAYPDAPPDPIHSYNIWALQWALIAKLYRLDPIELYSRAAFLTVPLATFSFYALGRRLFTADVSRTALFLFCSYQVIYGGMLFLGRTTFYPADSQWLIAFPSCLCLFLLVVEGRERGCFHNLGGLIALALTVLAMSITHVLWGLCFYLVLGFFALALLLRRLGLGRAVAAAWKCGGGRSLSLALLLAATPLVFALIDCIAMIRSDNLQGFSPLIGGGADFSTPAYALVFVILPAAIVLAAAWRHRPRATLQELDMEYTVLFIVIVIAVCLAAAVPYILVRSRTVESTDWTQFGRNPYRAFITPGLFFLNPFERSLQNPNMTFYPIYLIGYLGLPLLLKKAREDYGYMIVIAVLTAVPLVCFHPVLATMFAEHFSLGYLRRLLRLAALFSFFPAALIVHRVAERVWSGLKRPMLNILLSLAICSVLAGACILFPASPTYYNHLAEKTLEIARNSPKNSLIYDDRPFQAIAENEWFKPNDVIFSDFWTSYRLTAHLPNYVAVQHKPGTGVPDQGRRMLFESEFFNPATDVSRMREILDRFRVRGVIINRSPGYRLYGFACGHPEAVGKLKADPEHFKLLYDRGDWAVFRYEPVGE